MQRLVNKEYELTAGTTVSELIKIDEVTTSDIKGFDLVVTTDAEDVEIKLRVGKSTDLPDLYSYIEIPTGDETITAGTTTTFVIDNARFEWVQYEFITTGATTVNTYLDKYIVGTR